MKKYYCIEPNCNNEICYKTWKYGQGRCRFCAQKEEKNNFFGKHHSNETRIKMKKSRNIGIDNSQFIDNRTNKIYYCTECGNEISRSSGFYGQGRCLSCENKRRHRIGIFNQIGEKSSNWKGGISFEQYPLEWTKVIREQIRKRDNNQCQICGKLEIELKGRFKKLDVHHKDYDKENSNPKNLISLCKSCHMKTNFNRKYWENYFKNLINSKEKYYV